MTVYSEGAVRSLTAQLQALEEEARAEIEGKKYREPREPRYTLASVSASIDRDMRTGRAKLVLEHCIMRLFYMQSAEEQLSARTIDANGEGVSKSDAQALTLMGAWILGHPRDRRLTGRWVVVATQMVMKYHRQLCAYANNSGHGMNVRFER